MMIKDERLALLYREYVILINVFEQIYVSQSIYQFPPFYYNFCYC